MPSRAVALPLPQSDSPGEDLYFFAVPLATHRAISDVASKRGLTFAQAMQQAVDAWMRDTPKP